MCKNATVMCLRAIEHSSSAQTSFVPKLTTMFTVTETKILSCRTLHSFDVLTKPLEYGDANVQHDSGVQILACVSVLLLVPSVAAGCCLGMVTC